MDTFTDLDEAFESFESLYVYRRRESSFMASFENIHQITEDMTLYDITNLRPYPLYVEEEIPVGSSAPFLSAGASLGPLFAEMNTEWLDRAARFDYAGWGNDFFAMSEGYSLVLPESSDRITHPPPRHVGVYVHHLDYGLCFPLDPTLVKILKAFNICLAQLHPLAVRGLICYLWVCRFKGFPETLSLCKILHYLHPSSTFPDSVGWYCLYSAKLKMTSLGTPTGVRNWNDRFFWFKVPEDYPFSMGFISPRLRMAGIETFVGLVQED